MRQMAKWEGHFDKRIFHAFVKAVGIYPVGSLVRLSSQRLAVVVEPGMESLLTPKVRVFFSLRSREPIPMQTIDLAATSRSEEHTSELQSLMRISYAVFCLKKKKSTDLTTMRAR